VLLGDLGITQRVEAERLTDVHIVAFTFSTL
jgi:hypothetical protein